LHARLVELGGSGVRVRRLGKDRAGEIRLTRFLHNPAVTVTEMVATAAARTSTRVTGRHVLAIQDTTMVRSAAEGIGVALHPLIAVDAVDGTLFGLLDARFFIRQGGQRNERRERDLAQKESGRWLEAAQRAAELAAVQAACVTVVSDREGDIYEDFADKPSAVEMLVRAGQDRRLADGSHLLAKTRMLPEAGRMAVDLPAAPGRRARTAIVSLRFCKVEIARPKHRTSDARAALPRAVALSLVEASEVNPPAGVDGAHWRLLTTHAVNDVADARRIVDFYRQRWTIEQLFRTLKTQGFNVEALRQAEGGPFERLVAASLIAAVTVLQLVRERDGVAKRPLEDAFDPDDRSALEAISADLEGQTAKQKNPHPKGSLAFAAWVFARLGGWSGYYGKPGPVVMLHGLTRFQAIKHGWALRNV
jgi:DDE family transposase